MYFVESLIAAGILLIATLTLLQATRTWMLALVYRGLQLLTVISAVCIFVCLFAPETKLETLESLVQQSDVPSWLKQTPDHWHDKWVWGIRGLIGMAVLLVGLIFSSLLKDLTAITSTFRLMKEEYEAMYPKLLEQIENLQNSADAERQIGDITAATSILGDTLRSRLSKARQPRARHG